MRLIDADALLDAISVHLERIEQEFDDAPTIDTVRHGKWEDKSLFDGDAIEEWQEARCSACGKYHTTPYMYYFDEFTFCPNCGARMDGGEE